MGDPTKYVPTTRLRWVRDADKQLYLEQWWAEDMAGYMRDQAEGEWRRVEEVDPQ